MTQNSSGFSVVYVNKRTFIPDLGKDKASSAQVLVVPSNALFQMLMEVAVVTGPKCTSFYK